MLPSPRSLRKRTNYRTNELQPFTAPELLLRSDRGKGDGTRNGNRDRLTYKSGVSIMWRFSTPARFSIVTLLVGVGFVSLLGGAALAGPPELITFNTRHPVVSFTACNTKAPLALSAMGLTVVGKNDNSNRQDIWYGHADKTTTIILCYPLPNGESVQIISTAANEGSGIDLDAFHKRLLQYFYDTGAAAGSPGK